jgi:hypothetical protein
VCLPLDIFFSETKKLIFFFLVTKASSGEGVGELISFIAKKFPLLNVKVQKLLIKGLAPYLGTGV